MSDNEAGGSEQQSAPEASFGDNKVSAAKLRDYVERVERLEDGKATYADDIKVVFAEAKSEGFDTKALRRLLKRRKLKPSELDEINAIDDLYSTVMGMRAEAPLFSHVGRMSVDIQSREQVINAFQKLVPSEGEIIIKVGAPVRMHRVEGKVVVEDYVEMQPTPLEKRSADSPVHEDKPEPPAVDEAGARELGREAYRQDNPITANPFPWGDARRREFDEGWRDESGTDGMGDD
jgi:uncharacterized protein (UPF0335 family)